jgi:hypothetical protein
MYTLGVTLAFAGFGVCMAITLYYVLDYQRSGILHRAHKRALLPSIGVAFITMAIGCLIFSRALGNL